MKNVFKAFFIFLACAGTVRPAGLDGIDKRITEIAGTQNRKSEKLITAGDVDLIAAAARRATKDSAQAEYFNGIEQALGRIKRIEKHASDLNDPKKFPSRLDEVLSNEGCGVELCMRFIADLKSLKDSNLAEKDFKHAVTERVNRFNTSWLGTLDTLFEKIALAKRMSQRNKGSELGYKEYLECNSADFDKVVQRYLGAVDAQRWSDQLQAQKDNELLRRLGEEGSAENRKRVERRGEVAKILIHLSKCEQEIARNKIEALNKHPLVEISDDYLTRIQACIDEAKNEAAVQEAAYQARIAQIKANEEGRREALKAALRMPQQAGEEDAAYPEDSGTQEGESVDEAAEKPKAGTKAQNEAPKNNNNSPRSAPSIATQNKQTYILPVTATAVAALLGINVLAERYVWNKLVVSGQTTLTFWQYLKQRFPQMKLSLQDKVNLIKWAALAVAVGGGSYAYASCA